MLIVLGWEYTVEATLGGYGPVERNYHMCRRRRWVRMRHLLTSVKTQTDLVSGRFAAGLTLITLLQRPHISMLSPVDLTFLSVVIMILECNYLVVMY